MGAVEGLRMLFSASITRPLSSALAITLTCFVRERACEDEAGKGGRRETARKEETKARPNSEPRESCDTLAATASAAKKVLSAPSNAGLPPPFARR